SATHSLACPLDSPNDARGFSGLRPGQEGRSPVMNGGRIAPPFDTLADAGSKRCHFFAAVSQACRPRLVPRPAMRPLALRGEKRRLEENGGRERRQKRQGHQLAHARRARMMREPKAAKRCRCGAGTEE